MMLQKIDVLEWETPRLGGWEDELMQPADYDGETIFVGPEKAPKFYVSLPPGVVLAREMADPAPADPFAELETWGCPECAGTGRNEYWLKCHLCHGHGVLYRRPASA